MVEAEWEGWLYGETAKCNQVELLIREDGTNSPNGKDGSSAKRQKPLGTEHLSWAQVRSWHEQYCGSCYSEKQSLIEKQGGSVGYKVEM